MKIQVSTLVHAPAERVWACYTEPSHIVQWNAASDDWHTTSASVDLQVGGAFSSRMAAKDGSFSFDFAGVYTEVSPPERLAYQFGERTALVEFTPQSIAGAVTVTVTFDAEQTHSPEEQQSGWQAILDNFARYTQSLP